MMFDSTRGRGLVHNIMKRKIVEHEDGEERTKKRAAIPALTTVNGMGDSSTFVYDVPRYGKVKHTEWPASLVSSPALPRAAPYHISLLAFSPQTGSYVGVVLL